MRKSYFIKSRHKLDRSCYWRLMESSTQAQSIKIYDFRISISEIRPMMNWMIEISLLTTLVMYKAYFKSHYTQKQRLRTHILCEKLLHMYALEFCNQVLPNLHCLWSEEFCSQQQSIKLLELVMCWDLCKGISHILGSMQMS